MKDKMPVEKLVPFLEERLHVKFESLKDSKGEVIRKGITELAIDPNDEMCVLAKISSINPDRSGEVVIPEGVNIEEYKVNPIICWSHDYSVPSVARTEAIEIKDDAIYAKIRFGSTEKCKEIWQLVKEKILNAMSIGFVTLETLEKGTKEFNDFIEKRLINIKDKFKDIERVITKCTLLEVSWVNLPCNNDALVQYISSKGMSADLKKDFGIKESDCSVGNDVAVEDKKEESNVASETITETEETEDKKEVNEEEKPEKPEVKEELVENNVNSEVINEEVKQENEEKYEVPTPENASSTPEESFSNTSPSTITDIPELIGQPKPEEPPYKSYFRIVEEPKKVDIAELIKKQVEIELKIKRGKIS